MLFSFVGLFWGSQILARDFLDDSENHWFWSLIFFKKTYIYLFIVCVHACIWTQAYHCRSENCLWELALLFSNVDPWDWTLVLVLVRKCLYSLVHLTRLTFFCYCHSVYFKRFFWADQLLKERHQNTPPWLSNWRLLYCSFVAFPL